MQSSLVVLSVLVAITCALNGVRIDPTISWRIVGGSDAPKGLYTHQISLQFKGKHMCGGSIIHAEWVITTAQCVRGFGNAASLLQVVTGTVKLSSGGTKYQVLEVHAHEKSSAPTISNDVAILKVKKIKFNKNVAPIAFEKNYIAGDVPLTLSGWGFKEFNGTVPDHLQHIQLKSLTVKECREKYEASGINYYPIYESHVCTFTKRGEGACFGDAGAPLIKEKGDGEHTLVGMLSRGVPCAEGYPDLSERVSFYIKWFNSKCNCIN